MPQKQSIPKAAGSSHPYPAVSHSPHSFSPLLGFSHFSCVQRAPSSLKIPLTLPNRRRERIGVKQERYISGTKLKEEQRFRIIPALSHRSQGTSIVHLKKLSKLSLPKKWQSQGFFQDVVPRTQPSSKLASWEPYVVWC